jgi:heterodisulfide reductase subunit B
MELSYYPGCSLHGTSLEYDESTRAVCSALDIGLEEIEDWSCCGASSAHSVAGDLSLALPARNLALASRSGRDVVVPCAACYNRLRAALVASREGRLPEGVGEIDGEIDVQSLVSIVARPEILSTLEGHVERRLEGLAVVPYYGCLLVRPGHVTGRTDLEDPRDMDTILGVLDADVRKWNYKTVCCGGGLALGRPDIVERLVFKIVAEARRSGADLIVTACPMCLTNLESRMFEAVREGRMAEDEVVPVVYFTELIGVAIGSPEVDGWLSKHLIDPRPVLKARGLT